MAEREPGRGIGYWWVRSQDWMDEVWDRIVVSRWFSFSAIATVWCCCLTIPLLLGRLAHSPLVMVIGAIAMVSLGFAVTLVGLRQSRALLRQHRQRAGQCLSCGYDLRESRRQCPEC